MENTLQNKAKFFALYWGQKLLNSVLDGGKVKVESYYLHKENIKPGDCLELTPLSQITDEDAIEVAKAEFSFFKECGGFETKVVREIRGISVAAIADNGKTCLAKISVSDPYKLTISGIDYLRSKGYALPYLGTSVETLIEWGWIRLKQSNGYENRN